MKMDESDFRPCKRCGFMFSPSINVCPKCGVAQKFERKDLLEILLLLISLVCMIYFAFPHLFR